MAETLSLHWPKNVFQMWRLSFFLSVSTFGGVRRAGPRVLLTTNVMILHAMLLLVRIFWLVHIAWAPENPSRASNWTITTLTLPRLVFRISSGITLVLILILMYFDWLWRHSLLAMNWQWLQIVIPALLATLSAFVFLKVQHSPSDIDPLTGILKSFVYVSSVLREGLKQGLRLDLHGARLCVEWSNCKLLAIDWVNELLINLIRGDGVPLLGRVVRTLPSVLPHYLLLHLLLRLRKVFN